MAERSAEKKFSHAMVKYGPGKGEERCRNCVHLIEAQPIRCELVKSPIINSGWCQLFKEKSASQAA